MSPENSSGSEYSNQNFVDFLIALGRKKKYLFALFSLFGVISCAVIFLWPRQYSSTLVFLPPQQQNSSSQAMAQLSALAGVGAVGPVKSSDELYFALLKVRGVGDGVMSDLKLLDRYAVKSKYEVSKILDERVNFALDKKTGLISISARDEDAAFSILIAKKYFDRLRKVVSGLAVTEAQQRRRYFEAQVEKSKATLSKSEVRFMKAQESGGFIVPQALAESGVKEGARIRSEIASREVKLASLRSYATDRNPEVDRMATEIAALRRQLEKLEGGGPSKESSAVDGESVAVQAYRDMKVQEAILEAMIKQLEISKADESREGPQLQLVDPPTLAEMPTYPRRGILLGVGVVASAIAAFFMVGFGIVLSSMKKSSDSTRALIDAWL